MYIPKVVATIGLAAFPILLFADDSSCPDSEYRAHLEAIDCQSVIVDFAEFVTQVQDEIERYNRSGSADRESILATLDIFATEEVELRDCLVKHGDPNSPQPIREIYTSASLASLALESWLKERPGSEMKKQWAMSTFEELVETMRKYEHNKAFNTDAANRCAG